MLDRTVTAASVSFVSVTFFQLKAIDDWRTFYLYHEDYIRIGVVYHEDGTGQSA